MLLLAVAALLTAAAVLPWPGGVPGVLGGFGMSASVLLGHSPGDVHYGFGRMLLLFLVFVIFVFAAVLLTALGALLRSRAVHRTGAALAGLLAVACGVVAFPVHPDLSVESAPFFGVAGFLLLAFWHARLARTPSHA
ncbi:hypothetical protein [Allokutzneria albata]|uniref:Uncharacterized protein n=1 Tax=Allokutzneria albata TaxID=211114 RepID=A0A1G9RNI4_ALLAB|nr:hypothetical protein [Allokutzneria albata]SDM24848.1 hypothetical protein SAMN04489726_0579 [Allokutzneria albata]